MSDINLNLPAWYVILFAAYEYWPVVLVAAVIASAIAVFRHGLSRALAIVVSVTLLADLALSGYLGLTYQRDETRRLASEQSMSSVLSAPRSVDGLQLPAGTAVTWTDATQTHVMAAAPRDPARLLGVLLTRMQRTLDDGWAVQLEGAQSVEGWPCQPDLVELRSDGRLRRCALAAPREWNGWPIPAATLVTLDRPGQTIGLVFPVDNPVMAREIGRNLPATGQMSLNPDGSLDTVYFEPEAPLIVCGQPLWNTVKWRYDPSTSGQGRDRKPVAVSGASPAGDPVE